MRAGETWGHCSCLQNGMHRIHRCTQTRSQNALTHAHTEEPRRHTRCTSHIILHNNIPPTYQQAPRKRRLRTVPRKLPGGVQVWHSAAHRHSNRSTWHATHSTHTGTLRHTTHRHSIILMHTETHMSACTQTHMSACTQAHSSMCSRGHTHTRTHSHTPFIHTCAHTQSHTRARTHTHIRTPPVTFAHTHTRVHTTRHSEDCARTHTHPHHPPPHTHTVEIRTHVHTVEARPLPELHPHRTPSL